MSNWGDLVIAYTSTMAYSPGFNGDKDVCSLTAKTAYLNMILILKSAIWGQHILQYLWSHSF